MRFLGSSHWPLAVIFRRIQMLEMTGHPYFVLRNLPTPCSVHPTPGPVASLQKSWYRVLRRSFLPSCPPTLQPAKTAQVWRDSLGATADYGAVAIPRNPSLAISNFPPPKAPKYSTKGNYGVPLRRQSTPYALDNKRLRLCACYPHSIPGKRIDA